MNKFLIISNSRCGSTWLTSSLNELEDVCTDYEVKIPPFPKKEMHILLDSNFPSLWKLLEPNLCLGSKLVLETQAYSYKLVEYLRHHIDEKIKIIFLTRSLIDQSMSIFRFGSTNKLKNISKGSQNLMGSQLSLMTQDESVLRQQNIVTLDPIWLSKLYADVQNRMANDLLISEYLKTCQNEWMHVDYSHLDEYWPNLCSFIGSNTSKSLSDVTVTSKVSSEFSSEELSVRNMLKPFDLLRDNFINIPIPSPNLYFTVKQALVK